MRVQPQIPIRRIRAVNHTQLPEPARIPTYIRDLLAEPTWSVKSLLPADKEQNPTKSTSTTSSTSSTKQEITVEKLHRLLRLSALPKPKTPQEEEKLLTSLHRHLHFVRAVQGVDTTKPPTWETPHVTPNSPIANAVWNSSSHEVEPLITIRDETFEGIGEATIHLRDLWPTLANEEQKGLNGGRRRRWKVNTNWDGGSEAEAEAEAEQVESKPGGEKGLQLDQAEIQKRMKTIEALAEKRDWWIDVDRLGGGLESRKKGKYFFVRRGKSEERKTHTIQPRDDEGNTFTSS